MQDTNTNQIDALTKELFTEVRAEYAGEELEKPKKNWKPVPDGEYTGRVHILANTVADEKSTNFGLKKWEIQILIAEGEEAGNTAYVNRVHLPSYLNVRPTDEGEVPAWRSKAKNYIRQTDRILAKCGVDISDTDPDMIVKRITENNRRKRFVNIVVKNGNTYVNDFIENNVEDGENSLLGEQYNNLPSGDDMPLM